MLKIERQNLILKYLEKNTFLKLIDLISILETSEATLRRDLNDLENEGKLIRVHGGAKSVKNKDYESDIILKKRINTDKKNAIAKKAALFLEDGQKIFLDAGTTTAALIPYISEKEDIEVITNGYSHIYSLTKKGIKTFLIAGEIKKKTQAIVGSTAILSLKNFYFDIAFLGANSIDENGFMTPDPDEAIVKEAVIKKAKKTYILADSSKFLEQKSIVFTNRKDVTLITEEKEA